MADTRRPFSRFEQRWNFSVDQYDKYRANAAEAQREANRTMNPEDKASWLRLVEGWLSLLPKRIRTASENFDEAAQSKGTGQDISKESQ